MNTIACAGLPIRKGQPRSAVRFLARLGGWLAGLLVAATGLVAGDYRDAALTVQLPVKALLNARVVTTVSNGTLIPWNKGIDDKWSGLATRGAADAMGSQAKFALPDDGVFPANAFHPAVRLHFANANASESQVRFTGKQVADRYAIGTGDERYASLSLFFMSAFGTSEISVELAYTDKTTELKQYAVVDWAALVPETETRYFLAANLAKWGPKNTELEKDHHYLLGINLQPDPAKAIARVTISKPASATSLVFWGATGYRAAQAGPRGRVSDATGAPISGAKVQTEQGSWVVTTDLRGEFILPGTNSQPQITPGNSGEAMLVVTREGYLDYEQPIAAWDAKDLVIRMLPCAATVRDIDGNAYQAVRLGGQIWTTTNFRATRFNDGSPIPFDGASPAWKDNTTPMYCNPPNVTDSGIIRKYGLLYNFYAVETRKLAPPGWHVPTAAEWVEFEKHLIGAGYNWDGSQTGDKIAKAISARTSWKLSDVPGAIGNNPGLNNACGFSAYGTGFRHESGIFEPAGNYTGWWTATAVSSDHAGMIDLHGNQAAWSNAHHYRSACGYAVRLIQDAK